METLADLVIASRGGDSAAFSKIVDRFSENAHARAYGILGDYHLAQDAVQEAFTEAFLNLDKLREPAAFPGWFKRIVIKRVDRLIRRKKLKTSTLDDAHDVAISDGEEDYSADQSLVSEALHRALDELPDHERDVAKLYYLGSQSQKEIAQGIEVPVTTIKKRLYTSRQRLRKRLADLETIDEITSDNARFPLAQQLFAAAYNGFATKAQSLLNQDPGLIDIANEDGMSILLYAVHASHNSGKTGVADLLVVRGAHVDPYVAAALGLVQHVAIRLEPRMHCINDKGAWGRTLLHWAAAGGHISLVEWLLSRGADIQARDQWGCTPLHLAAEYGHLWIVKTLVARGADAKARLKNGKGPIHVASQKGHCAVVEELLQHGANLDVFAAVSLGLTDQVQKMLRQDPFLVNARLPFGATPLHMAAEDGQLRMAEFLVDKGAELDIVCAVELGWIDDVAKFLKKEPEEINVQGGSFGFTPLHSASTKGRGDVARLLLANGAEVNATDLMFKKTPLGEALYYGNESMARLLYEFGAQA